MWEQLIKQELIINQHYWNRYVKFINSRAVIDTSSGTEIHHKWPKSYGRVDDDYNLVNLTLREHYLAHWILSRAMRGKMSAAFWLMTNLRNKSGRMYDEARRNAPSHAHTEATKDKLRYKKTDEHKRKISEAHLGKQKPASMKLKLKETIMSKSQEWRSNRSSAGGKSLAGVPKSEEHKKKLADNNIARNSSEDQRAKVSQALKGRKVYANPETKEIVRVHEHPGEGWHIWNSRWGFVDKELRLKFPKQSFIAQS